MSGEVSMVETLISTLSVSNSPWDAWELEFIESLEGKEFTDLSPKQRTKVEELFERL
jgi:hypothetical protein